MPAKKSSPGKTGRILLLPGKNWRLGKLKNRHFFPERKQMPAGGLFDYFFLPERLVLLSQKKKQKGLLPQKEKLKKAGKNKVCSCQKKNSFSQLGNFGEEKPRPSVPFHGLGNCR